MPPPSTAAPAAMRTTTGAVTVEDRSRLRVGTASAGSSERGGTGGPHGSFECTAVGRDHHGGPGSSGGFRSSVIESIVPGPRHPLTGMPKDQPKGLIQPP